MKLGRDEVLMVPYKCCCFSARSVQWRIQGGAKIGHWGSPSSTNFFFRLEGYSNKPNEWQWSRSIWDEVLFFLVPFRSQIFDAFWRLFGLSHFALFQCNFYRFLCCKVFNLHLFCIISMFVSGKCLYKRFKCFKNFNEFSMYLFRWRKGGGCTNACICMGTHTAPICLNFNFFVFKLCSNWQLFDCN